MPFFEQNISTDSADDLKKVGELLDVPRVCQFLLLGIDHDNGHTPVILTTIPAEHLGDYLIALGTAQNYPNDVIEMPPDPTH